MTLWHPRFILAGLYEVRVYRSLALLGLRLLLNYKFINKLIFPATISRSGTECVFT